MENKCTNELIEKVRTLRERNLSWDIVAKAVGVGRSTLFEWKDPESSQYNENFALMCEEAEEVVADKTKADQAKQSQFHKLRKVIFELREVDIRSLDKREKKKFKKLRSADREEKREFPELMPPPGMPPSWLTKQYIIDYADQVLDLTLDPGANINEMRAECLLRIKELTVTVKVKIVTEQEVDPSAQAVKNVLSNMGNKDERWDLSEKREHEAGKELKNFMDWLADRDDASGK